MSSYTDTTDTPIGTAVVTDGYHLYGHTLCNKGVSGGGGHARGCNGGELSKVSAVVHTQARQKPKSKTPLTEWIPPELQLPDTLEEIERGRIVQQELFPERPDDSRSARIARLCMIGDIITADRLQTSTSDSGGHLAGRHGTSTRAAGTHRSNAYATILVKEQ